MWLKVAYASSSADRGLALIHTRQGIFRGSSSLRARQGATPDAYDARTARIYPVRRCSSLSARAERADRVEAESRLIRRLHLDAIDATDESGGCPHRGRKDKETQYPQLRTSAARAASTARGARAPGRPTGERPHLKPSTPLRGPPNLGRPPRGLRASTRRGRRAWPTLRRLNPEHRRTGTFW